MPSDGGRWNTDGLRRVLAVDSLTGVWRPFFEQLATRSD
jgi:hypothetical protein